MQYAMLQSDGHLVRHLLSLWLWTAALGCGAWADETVRTPQALPGGLSAAEQQSLRQETNPKGYVDTCLKIGVAHLTTAAEALKRERFDTAAQALRVYTGIIEYTHHYTQQIVNEKLRRQMLRKLETTLRQHLPLLEWMVNGLPECHEGCARQALQCAKTIRRDALNAFFGSEFLKAGSEATTE